MINKVDSLKKNKKLFSLILSVIFVLIMTSMILIKASATEEMDLMPSDLFVNNSSVKIENNAKLPDYASSYIFRKNSHNAQTVSSALKISSTGINNANLAFKNTIDLSRYGKDDSLIEFIILPNQQGANDITLFQLKLTDIYDSSNILIIELGERSDVNYVSSTRAGTNSQTVSGYVSAKDEMDSLFGTHTRSGFYGLNNNTVQDARYGVANFSIDYQNKTVYTYPDANFAQNLVKKLDSSKYMLQGDLLWEGFTTGEVKAEIVLSGLKNSGASIYMLSFNDVDFTGEKLSDTVAPEIYWNENIDIQNLPFAEVNKPYKVFEEISAYDKSNGVIPKNQITTEVFKVENEERVKVDIIDGAVIPRSEGEYIITYTTYDLLKNKGILEVKFLAQNKVKPLQFALLGSIPEFSTTGQYIEIPDYFINYGSGYHTIKTEVFVNGNTIDITDNKFELATQGYYTLKFTVYDYIETYVFEEYIKVNTITNPEIYNIPNLTSAVNSGSLIKLVDFEAYDFYSFGEKTPALKQILVSENDQEFEPINDDLTYQVKAQSGFIKIKYQATAVLDNTKITEKIYTLPIIQAEKSTEYFYNNVGITEIIYNDKQAIISALEDNSEVSFISALPYEGFKFGFIIPQEYKNFEKLTLTLEDFENKNQKITIDYIKSTEFTSIIVINNKDSFEISGGFGSKSSFDLTFKQGNYINANGVSLTKLTKDLNNKSFSGFNSGKLYMSIKFTGVLGDSGIIPVELCNHTTFTDSKADNSKPMIILEEQIQFKQYLNTFITVPKAWGIDVISGDAQVYVTVAKDREVIINRLVADKEYKFLAKDFGFYRITYIAVDKAGNEAEVQFSIRVIETIKPQIIVDGIIDAVAKVNEKYTIPQVSAKKYNGETTDVKCFVENDAGKVVEITDSYFIPDQKGYYDIYFYAEDGAAYNISTYRIYAS